MRADRRRIKFSCWCSECLAAGRKRKALRWSNGSYDAYCREHKRENAAAYMRKRRAAETGR